MISMNAQRQCALVPPGKRKRVRKAIANKGQDGERVFRRRKAQVDADNTQEIPDEDKGKMLEEKPQLTAEELQKLHNHKFLAWCERGSTKGVKTELDRGGADINVRCPNTGMTGLSHACSQGNIEVVELLVERKADLTITDDKGRTALIIAKKEGHNGIIELLRKAGATE